MHLQAKPLRYPGEKEPPERQALADRGKRGRQEKSKVKVMERVQRPVGAPEPAEHRQGQRGWRLKCTQTVREE